MGDCPGWKSNCRYRHHYNHRIQEKTENRVFLRDWWMWVWGCAFAPVGPAAAIKDLNSNHLTRLERRKHEELLILVIRDELRRLLDWRY